jgi:hypothetical protein
VVRRRTYERTGIDFLENWVDKNVTEADRKGSLERARELATRCLAEASALGISVDDMEPEWEQR